MAGNSQPTSVFDTHNTQPIPYTVQKINEKLEITYSGNASNEQRHEAYVFLNGTKNSWEGPLYGFTIASDDCQSDAARYYGLQVLEDAIRFKWRNYKSPQIQQMLQWVQLLAFSVRATDKSFIRNKIAALFAEVAKRSWGDEWMDMDGMLAEMWEQPEEGKAFSCKLFVLYVLENLSEDIKNREDAIAGLRSDALGSALYEIMVPQVLHKEPEATNGHRADIRHGEDGWLHRMVALAAWCLKEMKLSTKQEYTAHLSECVVKTLRAMRPTLQWIDLRAPFQVNALGCAGLAFYVDDTTIQIAAVELLWTLLTRQRTHDVWMAMHKQALDLDSISVIAKVFKGAQSSPGEDEEKYLLQKKLAEVIGHLAEMMNKHSELAEGNVNLDSFFELVQNVVQSNSLVVSIPALYGWRKILEDPNDKLSEHIYRALAALVQLCSKRLLRYELVSDSDAEGDEIVQYLFDDFDVMPQRHEFLGNYRRFCVDVIRNVTRMRPHEALEHVLGQLQTMLQTGPYTFGRGFHSASYGKNRPSFLQFDAQYQVVLAALKGYAGWLTDTDAIKPDDEAYARVAGDRKATMVTLQQWCYGIVNLHIDDPEVAGLVLVLMVYILKTIDLEPQFVLSILQHALSMQLYDNPTHEAFSDAVKSFENLRVGELQKIARAFPDDLFSVYHELEPRVNVFIQKYGADLRLAWAYRAFMLNIVGRASGLPYDDRTKHLSARLQPLHAAWTAPALDASLSSFDAFCRTLGMANLDAFYSAKGFDGIADWSSQQLDAQGQALQNSIKGAVDRLPLRMTKSMLEASAEKHKVDAEAFQAISKIWKDLIPHIAPRIMLMIKYATAFHNMDNYSRLSPGLQACIKRTLQDRFWQSGISSETKEEFYARISGSKTSYEGFASVVRGTMRNIREMGYQILFYMTKYDQEFYNFPATPILERPLTDEERESLPQQLTDAVRKDLAEPLADALFTDAGSLSPNHLGLLIDLTTGLVKNCPAPLQEAFLPTMIRMLFIKLGDKVHSEWQAISNVDQTQGSNDELGDEMRVESVLRQLSHSMVCFIESLVQGDAKAKAPNAADQQLHGPIGDQNMAAREYKKPTVGRLALRDRFVLEPLMVFCAAALRFHDTRCCIKISQILRSIISRFAAGDVAAANGASVRDFICTNVLQAAISSLHEPYFAADNIQRELASLIALILLCYTPLCNTARAVLLSMQEMTPSKVDSYIQRLVKSVSEKQQRALVLELLEGVRGVSIHESHKMAREEKPKKKTTPAVAFMDVEQAPRVVPGEETGLEDVAGMFEGGA